MIHVSIGNRSRSPFRPLSLRMMSRADLISEPSDCAVVGAARVFVMELAFIQIRVGRPCGRNSGFDDRRPVLRRKQTLAIEVERCTANFVREVSVETRSDRCTHPWDRFRQFCLRQSATECLSNLAHDLYVHVLIELLPCLTRSDIACDPNQLRESDLLCRVSWARCVTEYVQRKEPLLLRFDSKTTISRIFADSAKVNG